MIYQETYQAGGDPSIMNFSSVIYTKSFPFTPPPRLSSSVNQQAFRHTAILFTKSATR